MRTSVQNRGRELAYTLRINSRSRSVRLSVKAGGAVFISVPKIPFARTLAEKFIRDKWDWILEQVEKSPKASAAKPGDYLKYKEIARAKIEKKVEEFNKIYGYQYGKVSIKRTSSRWGSCSGRKNLNFHYRLIFLPEEMMDYVVAHEICHLKQMNHSKDFWTLVEIAIPDYKRIVKDFKKIKL